MTEDWTCFTCGELKVNCECEEDGMKITKPKTINESIDELQEFFLADLYTKFRPEEEVNGKTYYREDVFKDEKEFEDYINGHFKILKKQVGELK